MTLWDLSLMLDFLAVAIWTLDVDNQTIEMVFTAYVRHHTAVKLTSFSYCSAIVAWSIESRKNKNGHSGSEVGLESNQVPSYYGTALYNK